jgi:hypothetical protein
MKMSAAIIFTAIIFYVIGLILLLCGVAIWNGKTGLIHYYHRQNVTDNKGFGKAMGKVVSGMGISCLISATLSFLGEDLIWISISVFFLGIIVPTIIALIIIKKYNGSIFS